MSLAGHIVLVTGAAGTLGQATAVAVRAAGGTVIAKCESRHGRLDGLVNNAGIVHVGSPGPTRSPPASSTCSPRRPRSSPVPKW
jgi:NAD(P)-dependent dehydrogenase (short-subunit alcohol dehydrogenase family)